MNGTLRAWLKALLASGVIGVAIVVWADTRANTRQLDRQYDEQKEHRVAHQDLEDKLHRLCVMLTRIGTALNVEGAGDCQ